MKITADRDDARRLAGLEPLRAAPQIDPGRVAAALDATGGFGGRNAAVVLTAV
ncbi:hypothetical protein [Kitasatospora indigofera]|uniref:hypothetical protein n=1 Tax=Kitasatospora indigofera TaxID=67307 RepID=UPI0033AB1502